MAAGETQDCPCLETLSLLSDCKTLLEKARQVIDANGYVYKKGKSRSHTKP